MKVHCFPYEIFKRNKAFFILITFDISSTNKSYLAFILFVFFANGGLLLRIVFRDDAHGPHCI